ncbi:HD domain [Actinobacteria bacterium IMCC26256]|nr:HD domain [Actinobacteria bacterium IMCC26256]
MHQSGGITTNNSFETDRQTKAEAEARDLFDGDFTKGLRPVPYIEHLEGVAASVAVHGGSDEQVAAAWLHDAVEDKGGAVRLDLIVTEYGSTVAAIVEACTDSWVEDSKDKENWLTRKVRYINHIASAPSEYVIVCAADKLDNVNRCREDYLIDGEALFNAFNRDSGRGGQLWYYRRVTEELVKRGVDTGGLLERLESSLSEWLDAVQAKNAGIDLESEFDGWCKTERDTVPTVGEAPERL